MVYIGQVYMTGAIRGQRRILKNKNSNFIFQKILELFLNFLREM